MWLYRCSGPSTNNNGSPLFQYDFTKLSSLKLKVTKKYHDYGVYNSHSKLFKPMFFYSKTIIVEFLEDQTPSTPDVSWFSIVQPLIFPGYFTTPPATPASIAGVPTMTFRAKASGTERLSLRRWKKSSRRPDKCLGNHWTVGMLISDVYLMIFWLLIL